MHVVSSAFTNFCPIVGPANSRQVIKKASNRRSCIVRASFSDEDVDDAMEQPRFVEYPPSAYNVSPPSLEQDWRLYRAQLVAREIDSNAQAPASLMVKPNDCWAHTIPHAEVGCLLVARESHLGMFANSLVLITEHNENAGTAALILNMPTPLTIANLGLEEDISTAFGRSPLSLGGPLQRNLLHVVHGRGDVDGAMRLVDGVFAGGVEHAAELVRTGLARPDEFKLLAGYSGWGPGQLEYEIERGSWWVVSAGSALILEIFRETNIGGFAGILGGSKMRTWEKVVSAAGIDRYRS